MEEEASFDIGLSQVRELLDPAELSDEILLNFCQETTMNLDLNLDNDKSNVTMNVDNHAVDNHAVNHAVKGNSGEEPQSQRFQSVLTESDINNT